MKTTIITENINSLQFIELRDCMQQCIEESMKALDSRDAESLMWYEDCSMNDYFYELQEIYDDGTRVGEGIDTNSHSFVLNDDTRIDFENAFEQARDAAFESVMKDLGEKIEDFYENDFEGFEEIEFPDDAEWDGEVKGYKVIGSDNTNETVFLEGRNDNLYFSIYNNMSAGLSADAFAARMGATAKAFSESREYCDWSAFYYKKEI